MLTPGKGSGAMAACGLALLRWAGRRTRRTGAMDAWESWLMVDERGALNR